MNIRIATYHDAPSIKFLLEELGYKTTISMLIGQLESTFGKDGHYLWVYELRKELAGFIVTHFVPQLGCNGELALIAYFLVDETVKDQGIARLLEQYVTEQAKKRKCERVQVTDMARSSLPRQFYLQQGYEEHPSYFSKRLRDDE